jgi:hypothetical protein
MTSFVIDLKRGQDSRCNVQDHTGFTMNTIILFSRMGLR